MLSLRELEAFAGAFATVFFPFFHAAVAGEVAGVTELLGHAARSRTGSRFALGRSARGFRRRAFRGQPEHGFQGAGHPLANSAGLPREASAMRRLRISASSSGPTTAARSLTSVK